MLARTRSRATYANVASTLALLVALSGAAYAGVFITGHDVKNGSLTGKDVANRSLKGRDVADSSIAEKKLKFPVLSALDFNHSGMTRTDSMAVSTGSDLIAYPVRTQAHDQMYFAGTAQVANANPGAGDVVVHLRVLMDGQALPGQFSQTLSGSRVHSVPLMIHFGDTTDGIHNVTLRATADGGTVTITDRTLLVGVWPQATN